jgi:hypothetical protein
MLQLQHDGRGEMKKLVALWLFAIACAASPKPASAPAAMGRSDVAPNDPHQRITDLSQQIDNERDKMQLAAPPLPASVEHATPMSEPPSSKTCQPGASQTCHDTCTLADSICTNAAEICKIAAELPGDTWADGKCATARSTCDSAHDKCCGCQP